jgi:hypothetical protein
MYTLRSPHSHFHVSLLHQINKSISALLARNRARNDASNRAEFLHLRRTSNASEDRPEGEGEGDEIESTSCSRTDAKTVDRDVMMKFDIAKNEEGPLRRTLKVEVKNDRNSPTDKNCDGNNSVTANRHPGADERLNNLETHLAMRYGKLVLFHDYAQSNGTCESTVASGITPSSHQVY